MKQPSVTIRGLEGSTEVEAKFDTGAVRTAIDHKTAAEVGAGPVATSVKTKQASGSERRPVVPVWIEVDGHHHLVEAGLSDREDMSTNVLVGRDVLDELDERPLAP
ncbi:hypothetical protein [Halosimplex sp. J119]